MPRSIALAFIISLAFCLGGSVASAAGKPVSFLNDVLPVLTKVGCNAGTCHGSQYGKGGFKLSLRGYDPEFDHQSILKEARGRRVAAVEPARSLVLRKPSG